MRKALHYRLPGERKLCRAKGPHAECLQANLTSLVEDVSCLACRRILAKAHDTLGKKLAR